jgi:putative flippase GtrA
MSRQRLLPFRSRSHFQRWLSFNAVGVIGALIQLASLTTLLALGLHYLTATALAVQVAVVHNFAWHERRTWSDRTGGGLAGTIRRLLRFNLTIGTLSIGQNLLLMRVLAGSLEFDFLAANLASVCACSFVNYFLCEKLVFAARLPLPASLLTPGGSELMHPPPEAKPMPQFQIHAKSLAFLLLISSLTTTNSPLRAQGPPAETVAGWDEYIQLTESRIERELGSRDGFFAYEFQPRRRVQAERAGIFSGRVVVSRMETRRRNGREVSVPGGKIHHWRGAVFIPGASLRSVLEMAGYSDGKRHRQEDVLESKVLERSGESVRVYLKLTRSRIVSVTYNTEHVISLRRLGRGKAASQSTSTKVAELANAGTRLEREKPPGDDRGFLWRLNSYWRYQQTEDGVVVECETLTLSRSIPAIAGPVISPIVDSVARESMTRTLASIKDRFEEER